MSHDDTEYIIPTSYDDNKLSTEDECAKMRRFKALLMNENDNEDTVYEGSSVNTIEEAAKKLTLEQKAEIMSSDRCKNVDLVKRKNMIKKWYSRVLSAAEKEAMTEKENLAAPTHMDEEGPLPAPPAADNDSNGESASKGNDLKVATEKVFDAIKSHVAKISAIMQHPDEWASTERLATVVTGTYNNLTDYVIETFALVHILKFKAKVTGSLFIASNEVDFCRCLTDLMECLPIPVFPIAKESGFVDMHGLVKELEGIHKDLLSFLRRCSGGEQLRKQWSNVITLLYPIENYEENVNLVKSKLVKINELFRSE